MSDHYRPNAIERASAPWLIRLSRLPRWLFMVTLAASLIVGLALFNPIGGVILLLVALFLAWLAAVGWSRQSTARSTVRMAVVALILSQAIIRFL